MKKPTTEEWLHEYQIGAARVIARYRRLYADDAGLCDLLDLCEQLVMAIQPPTPAEAPAPSGTLLKIDPSRADQPEVSQPGHGLAFFA